jgi:hypothetical protein
MRQQAADRAAKLAALEKKILFEIKAHPESNSKTRICRS